MFLSKNRFFMLIYPSKNVSLQHIHVCERIMRVAYAYKKTQKLIS